MRWMTWWPTHEMYCLEREFVPEKMTKKEFDFLMKNWKHILAYSVVADEELAC